MRSVSNTKQCDIFLLPLSFLCNLNRCQYRYLYTKNRKFYKLFFQEKVLASCGGGLELADYNEVNSKLTFFTKKRKVVGMKIDVLQVKGDVVIHKQYEHRNGMNYVRVKKRPLWTMHRSSLTSGFMSEDLFKA